jgi:hypothetical protein
MLPRVIGGRPFERRFNLADFVEVKRASFEDGLKHRGFELSQFP